LPQGIVIAAARTQLVRPTTMARLCATRMCAEMGRRMIADLQRSDGQRLEEDACRLSTITPAEYVERFRDRLPSKITGKAFCAKFGELRGLNGQLEPQEVYKVRSRSEHHIYENRRVHEYATDIVRARRSGSDESLAQAGELMYASHWSYSQRCGIGGVESDRLVTSIRQRGSEVGLFGAKVTAGGAGGEIVVLMRDDEAAHRALAEAVAEAESACDCKIGTWQGSLSGAEHFQPPELETVLETAETAETA
jgi:L-arabinokinase